MPSPLVQLAEDVVGLREVGSAGAKGAFKFRFADLAVTISVELREQVFQRVRPAGQVEPIDDWPCAASRAPMVAGDICDFPPGQGGGVELPEAGPLPEKSKGFVELCPKPVDCGEDDFDDVSDCSASNADDTAPRASSMANLRQMPHSAALYFPSRSISKRHAMMKKPTKP